MPCLISTIKTVMMMVLFFLSLFPTTQPPEGNILLSNIKWTLELSILKEQPTVAEAETLPLLSELSMVRSKAFNLSNLRSGK